MEDDCFTHEGQTFCEDCYIEASQRIRICDPWGERSKRVYRESHGLSGTDGLTPIQKKIYETIQSKGKATREELTAEMGLSAREFENEFAILRHCQLLKAKREGDVIYLVLW